MKILILGSGASQGIPIIGCKCEVCRSSDERDRRLRSSVFIETDGVSIIIDAGPDFREQMLREQVGALDGVLITHAHRDHVGGLDDTRAFNCLQKKSIPVYGNETTLHQIRRLYFYAFESPSHPALPQWTLCPVAEEPFHIGGTMVTPIPVTHGNLPILGYRIGNFCYVTDANQIDEKAKRRMHGVEILIITALRQKKHSAHFNLAEAQAMAEEIGARITYFSHIGHRLGLHSEVERMLPQKMRLAYDSMLITL